MNQTHGPERAATGKSRPASAPPLTESTLVVAAKDQVSCDLCEEKVILSFRKGVYYGLSTVGARIWNLIQTPRALAEIRDVIVSEYEVEPDRCAADVLNLLTQLASEGLIEVVDEPNP